MRTENLRIEAFEPLDAPAAIQAELPADEAVLTFVAAAREEIRDALWGRDPRPLFIVGPCSIHDPEAGREYAGRLAELLVELATDPDRLASAAAACRAD